MSVYVIASLTIKDASTSRWRMRHPHGYPKVDQMVLTFDPCP